MKYVILTIFFLGCSVGLTAQTQEDEIIIEMTGDSTKSTPRKHPLWDYSASQLAKQWRNKTREQLLYAMPIVSDKDRIITSPKAEYALVEYTDGNDFRKFLFKAETPQTFITAAATAADVLAINKKYKVNIGLTQIDFENFYAKNAVSQQADLLEDDEVFYELTYTDLNTPHSEKNWFLFKNRKLAQTFYTQKQKDEFVEQRKQALARKQKEQQEAEQAATAADESQQNVIQKALLYGGTTYDQAYMPRVINPNPKLMPGNTATSR